ncbi:MAG: RIP metalloprotease RseP [Pseudomonadota bacterium]
MSELLDLLQVMAGNVWMYGVTFLVVLSILVFVHEWGHYIVAKMCGVKIETFSIGFGKELFGWNDKSGTRWRFALIPLGGYVKMFGDTDPASAGSSDIVNGQHMNANEKSQAFFAKPVWQRSLIVFAGPAVNFLFAILILSVLFATLGRPVSAPIVAAVEIGGAADVAGLQPQDRIVAIDGVAISQFEDVREKVAIALDTPLQMLIDRNGAQQTVTVTPVRQEIEDRFGFTHERGLVGIYGPSNGIGLASIRGVAGQDTDEADISKTAAMLKNKFGAPFKITLSKADGGKTDVLINPPQDKNVDLTTTAAQDPTKTGLMLAASPNDNKVVYSPVGAIAQGAKVTWSSIKNTLFAIQQMIMGVRNPTELGGIIRIGAVAGDMAEQGMIALFSFMAMLSINLGLINLFPIPMLDGGHLVFYGIEAARGKPLSDRALEYAFRGGLVILVALMVFSNLNDILQLVL